ncbi:hypothetical protein HPB50_025774 [Hyalomma asiaticum]|uniref:Uncharacterized protein n=1 Tax=Hyalomma asiaticum TaxID=266040 RepID=A0ACB7RT38_HYAAI|nr:hypothetical protein HPB50_025774 [Hyalomma asiaticum]
MAPPLPPPQIIVEELSGDDQYEDVGEAPSCDRLLTVDGAWLEQPPRRVRRSYRADVSWGARGKDIDWHVMNVPGSCGSDRSWSSDEWPVQDSDKISSVRV